MVVLAASAVVAVVVVGLAVEPLSRLIATTRVVLAASIAVIAQGLPLSYSVEVA